MNNRNRSLVVALATLTSSAIVTACVAGSNGETDMVEEEVVSKAQEELVVCNAPECIVYDLATQDACTEVTEGPAWDDRWTKGLSLEIDQTIKGGNIVAFQLQWFNGTWSGWYVAGVNDIDWKFNTNNKTMRRLWSYFNDHTHRFIICAKQP